jgi:hypothetical protein
MKTLKFILTTLVISTIVFSCDERTTGVQPAQAFTSQNDSHFSPTADYESRQLVTKMEEIMVPGSVDINLLIAIYDQHLPTESRVVLHYKDSTRTLAIKSTFDEGKPTVNEELTKLSDNEFKSKFGDEKYLIKGDHVYWTYSSGPLGTSYEYLRLDNIKNGLTD